MDEALEELRGGNRPRMPPASIFHVGEFESIILS